MLFQNFQNLALNFTLDVENYDFDNKSAFKRGYKNFLWLIATLQ